jgi:GT2 family glycosyltransferase
VLFFTKNTSLIIPTKNRSFKVIDLLEFFKTYKIQFFEILVIDSSNKENSIILKNQSKKLKFKYFHTRPSTSYQRNVGLKKKNPSTRFVMFLDDDVIFYKNAFKEMNKVIVKYLSIKEIGGFGFNQMQKQISKNFFEKIKNSKVINRIGLYSNKPGKVLRSGWHSKILNVKKNTYADWIYTTACIYKTEAICNLKFDENFGQYSYLEDLDFSLNLKNLKKKIVISYLAKFTHPNNIDRSSLIFGITEVINRFRIVKKYKLNLCYFFIVSLLTKYRKIHLYIYLQIYKCINV